LTNQFWLGIINQNLKFFMIVDFVVLNDSLVGQEIEVGGFVHTIRDHGGLIFIDLRSQTDLLQCVIDPTANPQSFQLAEQVHPEYVLKIRGKLSTRTPETVNPNLLTGKYELRIDKLEVVSQAKPLPFDLHATGDKLAGEDIRLKYRYLDLRRDKLKQMLTRKHKLILAIRNWFDQQNFVEVQTPILANSSPEGARDYLVPSRLHPGKFYALPQAPQQFKQLLMVGGFNKYFQIAPCFRDEDPRSDRHPGDFYQIDAEIAWAEQEDIFRLNEQLITEVLSKFSHKKLASEIIRLPYVEVMDKYGTDKPDLRYDLAWQDAKPVFAGSGFKIFADLCDNDQARVQALVLKQVVDKFSRSDLDRIQDIGRDHGLPGIAYIQYLADGLKSPIFKFLGETAEKIEFKKKELTEYFGLETGDLVLFIANSDKNLVFKAQNQIRQHIAKHLDLIDQNILQFAWVYDFPFFEADEKTGKIDFGHNPFSLWQGDLQTLRTARTEGRLLDLKAWQYDLTLNGFEVLSGGVRNPHPEWLMEAFQTVGYTVDEVRSKFRHMLEAYEFGAPKHAGFAWGLDRLFMILMEEDNIREVIAFPKNGSGLDVMTGSPSRIGQRQLKELGIELET
jgi:aspartyl-tRNA synthetase